MEGLRLFKNFVDQSLGNTASKPLIDLDAAEKTLRQILDEQKELLEESDESQRFIALLRAAFVSGHAHLDMLPTPPTLAGHSSFAPSPSFSKALLNFGWQQGNDAHQDYIAKGPRIGWYVDDRLYLEEESAYSVVEKLASVQGTSMGIGSKTLFKRMNSKGFLLETEKNRTTIRKKIRGKQIRVLVLAVSTIYPEEPTDDVSWSETINSAFPWANSDSDMKLDISGELTPS